jgi:hypothetical protein
MNRPYSIKIYLPDGTPDGLKIIEKSNWNGKGVVCPRSSFPDNKAREEFSRTGIYILLGPSEQSDVNMLYVGQGDPIKRRLDSHYANKDFWTRAVFFVSKDDNLNKAHIGHLESKLITMATEAKRCLLDNQNCPALPSMSEMDVADAEGFLEEILLCLPVLGINEFNKPEANVLKNKSRLFLKGPNCIAEGKETAEGLTVFEGAHARIEETASIHKYMTDARENLLRREIFKEEEGKYILTQDYTFSSPSAAAAIFLARNANGRTEWKDSTGKTLKEIQEAISK